MLRLDVQTAVRHATTLAAAFQVVTDCRCGHVVVCSHVLGIGVALVSEREVTAFRGLGAGLESFNGCCQGMLARLLMTCRPLFDGWKSRSEASTLGYFSHRLGRAHVAE